MSKKHTKRCETCIHAQVCYLKANRDNYTGVLKMTPCSHHRTESDSLDMPCSVGDTVYILVNLKGGRPSHYRAKTCIGIHISYQKFVPHQYGNESKYLIVNSDTGHAEHIPFREIGKNVFFSEEEARKAVEERLNAYK